jgi:hypothetical protein
MRVLARCGALVLAIAIVALPASADEIRLKDGKKLYGVIVAYEENMFKVKTDFGYVLVEKDKIASIIPTTPATKPDAQAAAKNGTDPSKGTPGEQPKPEPVVATGSQVSPNATPANAKVPAPATPSKGEKAKGAPVRPDLPSSAKATDPAAPAIKANPPTTTATLTAPTPPPPAETSAIREEVQANVYINHTYGFRMYKAPSWQLIDDARNALPNAVVAMGTSDESSLLIVGREKTKEPLDAAAATVERRLHAVYENYRLTSQRKTTVGGSPAVEFRYIGKADERDWSGILVVIARNGDIFTLLGMTHADSDLIQIQENVLAKSIASLSFDVH